MPRHRPARGVSLIELIVVIVLVGLMSLLAASAMGGGFKGMQLRGAAREVASQLRYTRTRAIASGQTQRFSIDPRTRVWEAPDGRRGELPPALGIEFTGARQAQVRDDAGAILFFHDGASTGGRVRLVREGAAWDVDVRWLTGEVRVARGPAR
ncbi:MAG: type II secretion system protein XpsH [Pseudomonadota bacterium]